jgi:hypothetical protein
MTFIQFCIKLHIHKWSKWEEEIWQSGKIVQYKWCTKCGKTEFRNR